MIESEEDTLEGDVLGLLQELQGLADEIDKIDAKRRTAADEKERVEEKLLDAETTLKAYEEKAHALDMSRRKRELAVRAEKEKLQRVMSRMGEVKSGREYQAVQAEINAARSNVVDLEGFLQTDVEELAKTEESVVNAKAVVEGIKEDLQAVEKNCDEIQQETEERREGMRSGEEAVLAKLPPEVVERYRLIRSRRGGLAVVEARDEACTACFMRIPPQTYIEVIRRTKVIQCPSCHRILVPPCSLEDAQDSD